MTKSSEIFMCIYIFSYTRGQRIRINNEHFHYLLLYKYAHIDTTQFGARENYVIQF